MRKRWLFPTGLHSGVEVCSMQVPEKKIGVMFFSPVDMEHEMGIMSVSETLDLIEGLRTAVYHLESTQEGDKES